MPSRRRGLVRNLVVAVALSVAAAPPVVGQDLEEDGPAADAPEATAEPLPDELAIRRNLGYALVTEGEYAAAWPHVEALLAAGDDSAWLHLSAAQICLYWLADYDCVDREATRALELRPDNARAYLLLGQMAEDRGDDDRAEQYYRESLERRGSQAEVSTRLAALLAEDGDVDQAVAVLEDAIGHHPRDARLYLTLGRLLEPVDPVRAEDAYQRAVRYHDEPVVAWGHLLRFYERQGRRRDADRVREILDAAVERRSFRPIR